MSWTINWEEYIKAFKIEEIASYFIPLNEVNNDTYEGGIFSWDPKECNEKRLFINSNTQRFKYGDIEGDVGDFIHFMCPDTEVTYFLKQLTGIERERYAGRFKYSDGTVIKITEYPIKDLDKYFGDPNLI